MQKTNIEYLGQTWNPMAMLCTPTESPGCLNCWHRRMTPRLAGNSHFTKEERAAWAGNGLPVLREKELEAPIRLKKPSRIGVQFMGDLFHEKVHYEHQRDIFECVLACPQHTFIVLTKWPDNALSFLKTWESVYFGHAVLADEYEFPPPNLWLGISASNQADLDRWAPVLLQIPAAKLFLSLEPLLGSVDVSPYIKKTPKAYKMLSRFYDEKEFRPEGDQPERSIPRLDGIVAGGESGPGARPSHPDWFRKVRDDCQEAGVPFFLKQLGEWIWYEGEPVSALYPKGTGFYRVGKKAAGRMLDGRIWDEWPE